MTGIVDVVVAVSRDAAATRRCLESVLAGGQQTPYEVVIVNDASPEADIVRHVRELATRRNVTLIDLPARQGCASALNQAFALHGDRDKVVVQSDAVVAGDWLDRLARHAGAPGVGVVGTFTNAVGVATYPVPYADNELPEGYDAATLDTLFSRANAGQAHSLPAVHGPCLYFRRECVAVVGAFDSSPLGSDYGIEIDFCLRAGSAGFRHLLAGDIFVGHAGRASFGAAAARELASRSRLALSKLYPTWAHQEAELRAHDPAKTFARRVDVARLALATRNVVVFVSHPWGGGIRRYMNDVAALIKDRAEVLYLEPAVDDTVKLYWPRAGECFAAYFKLPEELPLLSEVLRMIGVVRMHYHHVHRLPRAILELPAAVGVPFDCTLHDYFPICPQYHLVTEDGHYCGEPDAMGCAACLTRRPSQWGLDINAWRGTFARFLRAADRLIAPTNDVAIRIRRYFPELDVNVWPHPEGATDPTPRIVRVVVLGNLSPGKGLHVVAACAEDAQKRGLPLAFRVLGSTTEPVPQFPDVPLSIVGQYDDAKLARLLVAERPDVILFAAQVPETYAYTMSVALDSDVPIVASALGAFPERLAGYPHATTVPWDAPAAEWNAALLAAAGATARPMSVDERLQATPLRAAVP
jgi:GT2 family glycosyltransferase/glycosyltransferase involved in cell wall biosynthesis